MVNDTDHVTVSLHIYGDIPTTRGGLNSIQTGISSCRSYLNRDKFALASARAGVKAGWDPLSWPPPAFTTENRVRKAKAPEVHRDTHEAELKTMARIFADVKSSDEVIKMLSDI